MLGSNRHEPLERRPLTLEEFLDRHAFLDRTTRTVRTEQAVDPVAAVVLDPFKIVRMKCPDRDDHFEPGSHGVELVRRGNRQLDTRATLVLVLGPRRSVALSGDEAGRTKRRTRWVEPIEDGAQPLAVDPRRADPLEGLVDASPFGHIDSLE